MRRLPSRLVRPGVLAAAYALLAAAAWAQTPTWQRTAGPYGGDALDVASAGAVSVATDGAALYRSLDAATWTVVATAAVSGVVAAPNGDFWTTGAAVLRSQDGGQTWAEAGAGLPAGGARSLAARADGTVVAATGSGVYRLAPGAATWQPTALSVPVSTVGVVPGDGTSGGAGGVVLAGLATTGIGAEVYAVARSEDGGQTWTVVPIGTYRRAEITGLAVLADGTVIVGGYPTSDTGRSASPHRSADAGRTWERVVGLPEGLVVSRVAASGQTVAVTGSSAESYVSTDAGTTWATVALAANGLAAGPGASLLVASARRGIVRSSDGLATATDATEGFGRAAVSLVDVRGDLVVAARLGDFGVGTGLYRSADRGASWARIPLGFDTRGLSDLHLDLAGRLFALPDRCFGEGCAASGVYRSLDGGLTWAPTPLVLPGTTTAGHLADGPDGALWALASSRALYCSPDRGDTWEPRGTAPFARTFAVGPDGTLWVGSDQPAVSVARSPDGGATWETVLAGAAGLRTGAIAVAPDGTVVVGARGIGYRSADGGQTWTTVDFGLTDVAAEVTSLQPAPDGGLFAGVAAGSAGTSAAVLRSRDGGLTWASVATGLPAASPATGLDLGTDGVLWAALGAGGLYRTSASTVVADEPEAASGLLALSVAPNPVRRAARVTLALREAQPAVRVVLVDVLGREVARLHDGPAAAGALALDLDAGGLTPGTYVVRASVGQEAATRRLVVVR